MITSSECWMKNECQKYKSNDNSCKDSDSFCIKLFKLNNLYDLALMTSKQRQHLNLKVDANKSDLEAFVFLKGVQDNISEFVEKGNNIYLFSKNTGNGKTSWSERLIQAYFKSIWYTTDMVCRGLFVSVPRYLLSIKENISYQNEYAVNVRDRIYDADIVIWDDIGTKTATSFEHENLLSIIDYRINNNKSNIFTSNVSPDEFFELVGDRLYSRVINNSKCIEFVGSDKRGAVI